MNPVASLELNWWAILVCSVVTFLLGGLWYAALFGRKWAEWEKYTPEDLAEMQKRAGPTYFVLFLTGAVFSLVMALIMGMAGIDDPAGGALLGLILWAGPAAMPLLSIQITSNRHAGVFFINTSYHLVYFVVTGLILGAWR